MAYTCTLTHRALDDRLTEYRAIAREAFMSVRREPHRVTLRFRPDPGVRRRVDALVALESECCAFLGYTVDERPDAIVLTLTAPAGGEPVMNELADVLEPWKG